MPVQLENTQKSFIDRSAFLNVLLDGHLNCMRCSDGWVKYSGYTREEILGKDFLTFLHPDEVPFALKARDRFLNEASSERNYCILTKSGEPRQVKLSALTQWFDGELQTVISIIDVTELHSFASEQRRLARTVKSYLEADLNAMTVQDEEFNWVYASPRALELFGYTDISEFPPAQEQRASPEEAAMRLEERKQIVELVTGEVFYNSTPLLLKSKSGAVLSAQMASRWFDNPNGVGRLLMNSYSDVTEHEAKRKDLRDALDQAQGLLAGGTSAFTVRDERFELIFISERAQELFGASEPGPYLTASKNLTEEMRVAQLQQVRALETDEVLHFAEFDQIEGPDGRTIHIRSSARWFKNPTGAGRLLYTALEDVTDLVESRAELEAAHLRQNKMLAVVGHELRTPCAALDMMIDQLDDELTNENFKRLKIASMQILDVLDDLRFVIKPERMDAERMDAAQLVIADPVKVLSDTTRYLESYLASYNLDVKSYLRDAYGYLCKFDAKALRHLISNLLKNAAVHSKGSIVQVTMSVVSTNDTHVVMNILVEDNGIGIISQHVPKIFEDFYRANLDVEGTGLGLGISREMAKRLCGDLRYFDSSLGGAGFALDLSLPLASSSEPSAIDEEITDFVHGRTILYAEDNLIISTITVKILQNAGATVLVARNGAEALDIASLNDFDLVITDIFMPEVDGFDLTRSLRRNEFTGPILGVTAATVGEEVETLLESGADRVIGKPLTLKSLQAVLQEYYGSERTIRA